MAIYKNITDILPDTEFTISEAGVAAGTIGTFATTSGTGADAQKTEGTYLLTLNHELITSGKGRDAIFSFAVAGNGATTVTLVSGGYGYAVNDTITINGERLGSSTATNIVLTVSAVSSAGTTTQGYKTVSLKSTQPIMEHRANSGRTIKVSNSYHLFEAKVSYNKLVRDDFNKIYNFLLEKQGTLKAFRMSLPQHQPLTRVDKEVNPRIIANASAGASSLRIAKILTGDADYPGHASTTPVLGNIFTISDSKDSTHTKAYIITRINNSTEQVGQSDEIFFSPPLQKSVNVAGGGNFGKHPSSIELNRPLMRVSLTSNDMNYSIDSAGLYTLSFSVREDLT